MSSNTGEVYEIKDENDWRNIISTFPKVVVFFSAVWCPPCRIIKADFLELADTHKKDKIVFLEVDIDKLRFLSNTFNVHSIPTFLYFCDGAVVEEVIGRHKNELTDAVLRLLDLPSSHNRKSQSTHFEPLKPTYFKRALKKILHIS